MRVVSGSGELSIRARIRRDIGLEHGEPVVLRREGGESGSRTVHTVTKQPQAQARAPYAGSGYTADDVVRARHEEAKR